MLPSVALSSMGLVCGVEESTPKVQKPSYLVSQSSSALAPSSDALCS